MKSLWFLFLIAITATAQSARQAQIVPEDLDPTTANARPTVEDQSLPCNGFLSLSDKAAIKAIMEAYRTAWLRGDASGVLQTFTSSSVLSPAQGADPVVGLQEIEKYWWPSNVPETKILQLDISVDQMEGDGCLAFARGSDTVAWSTSQKGNVTKTWHKGKYLNVMKKMPDGNWRILQHMWDDQPNESFSVINHLTAY